MKTNKTSAVPAKKETSYTPSASDAKQALALDKGIKQGIATIVTSFLEVACYCYEVQYKGSDRERPLYRALGFKTWANYADTLGMGLSDSKNLVRVGRMLSYGNTYGTLIGSETYWTIHTSDAEMIACGKASIIELARLAPNPEQFDLNADMIVDLIGQRASGTMTHAKLKETIDAYLGKNESKDTGESDGDGDGDGEQVDMTGSNEPAWKTELKRILGSASTIEAFMEAAAAVQAEPAKSNLLTMVA